MSKVYALWPLIPHFAPRSLALLRRSTITYSVVNGESERKFLAAIPFTKVNVLLGRVVSCRKNCRKNSNKSGLFRVGGRGMEME